MKITILADLYEGDNHDQAVDHVAPALRQGGHMVSRLLVPGELRAVTNRRGPELVFVKRGRNGLRRRIHDSTRMNRDIASMEYGQFLYQRNGPAETHVSAGPFVLEGASMGNR
jgi:hypothetical protein